MRKGNITVKFQSLKRVLVEGTKGFVTRKVSGRSRNGPLLSRYCLSSAKNCEEHTHSF